MVKDGYITVFLIDLQIEICRVHRFCLKMVLKFWNWDFKQYLCFCFSYAGIVNLLFVAKTCKNTEKKHNIIIKKAVIFSNFMSHTSRSEMLNYSCNRITKTRIQTSCQKWNGFSSNISHQMMIWLTPIVSKSKKKWYKRQNWIIALSNSDKQCSNAHFVSFLYYYNCKTHFLENTKLF